MIELLKTAALTGLALGVGCSVAALVVFVFLVLVTRIWDFGDWMRERSIRRRLHKAKPAER